MPPLYLRPKGRLTDARFHDDHGVYPRLQTLLGGNITLFTELCEKTRAEAFEMMVGHAEQLGANAIVGIRYDGAEVMQGVSEVLCYGTAQVVEAT